MRSSASRTSGVSAAPKSAASNTWRISISDSPSSGLGQRLTHSIASSFEAAWNIQKPAISSFVSAKGPSVTVRFAPRNLTRALRARLKALTREQHAGLHQFLIVLAHLGEDLLVGQRARLRRLVGPDHDHESHRRRLSFVGFGALPADGLDRPNPGST